MVGISREDLRERLVVRSVPGGSLNWTMDPEGFVTALSRAIARMRRRSDGSRRAARHIHDVARRRKAWYRRVTGATTLPRLASGSGMGSEWVEADASEIRIVIPGPGDQFAGDAARQRANDPRKEMRRLVREIGSAEGGIELVTARSRRRRLPSVAQTAAGRRADWRGLYLAELDVAILPSLSDEQVRTLEGAGAIVLANELVSVDDPAASSASKGAPNLGHLRSIDVDAARRRGLTGKGVSIGVLDTGIDPGHPEFAGKSIDYMAFKPNGERRPIAAKDFAAHGTHVAALCAGRTVGVAPDADLVVAAVMTERGVDGRPIGYAAQILAGMNWLAGAGRLRRPVDIMNASLGSSTSPESFHLPMYTYRLAGTLSVAAIGNNGRFGFGNHMAPGMLDCALAVGAVDEEGRIVDFSAWGHCHDGSGFSPACKPDLVAPGVGVESAVPAGRYARSDGTSMASPIVAGAAALLIERDERLRGNPDALVDAVLGLVEPLPAQPKGSDPRRGGRGRLNLASLDRGSTDVGKVR